VLDAYAATKLAASDAAWAGDGAARRRDVPMGGHATHDEREARETVSAALFEHWGKRIQSGCTRNTRRPDGITVKQLEEIEPT